MTSINLWMDFFLDAGIPDLTAATYATNFANNRIEMSMLPELNKGYLKDLEIHLLGDIITILRHAKIVTEQQTSERVLGDKDKVKPAKPAKSTGSSISRNTSSSSRDLTGSKEAKPVVSGSSGSRVTTIQPKSRQSSVSSPTAVMDSVSFEDKPRKVKKEKSSMSSYGESTGSRETTINARLGPKVEEIKDEDPFDMEDSRSSKSSVFQRLGGQEAKRGMKEQEISPVTTTSTTGTTTIFNRLAPIKFQPLKIQPPEEHQIKRDNSDQSSSSIRINFTDDSRPGSSGRRAEKDDTHSTQSCRVSSTDEVNNPPVSILKQRGVKAGIVKSKSTSSIISLKPTEASKKKVRVSFGENDVRCMSPRAKPQGIQARLGEPAQYDNSDDNGDQDMEPITASSRQDLRQNLIKNLVRTGRIGSDDDDGSLNTVRTRGNKVLLAPSADKPRPLVKPKTLSLTPRMKKKFYIVQTLKDGTKEKVEVEPDHPLLRKLHERERLRTENEEGSERPKPEETKMAGLKRQIVRTVATKSDNTLSEPTESRESLYSKKMRQEVTYKEEPSRQFQTSDSRASRIDIGQRRQDRELIERRVDVDTRASRGGQYLGHEVYVNEEIGRDRSPIRRMRVGSADSTRITREMDIMKMDVDELEQRVAERQQRLEILKMQSAKLAIPEHCDVSPVRSRNTTPKTICIDADDAEDYRRHTGVSTSGSRHHSYKRSHSDLDEASYDRRGTTFGGTMRADQHYKSVSMIDRLSSMSSLRRPTTTSYSSSGAGGGMRDPSRSPPTERYESSYQRASTNRNDYYREESVHSRLGSRF